MHFDICTSALKPNPNPTLHTTGGLSYIVYRALVMHLTPHDYSLDPPTQALVNAADRTPRPSSRIKGKVMCAMNRSQSAASGREALQRTALVAHTTATITQGRGGRSLWMHKRSTRTSQRVTLRYVHVCCTSVSSWGDHCSLRRPPRVA